MNVNLEQLLQEIIERDARDRERAVSPLEPAKDAWVVNTDGMGIETGWDRMAPES